MFIRSFALAALLAGATTQFAQAQDAGQWGAEGPPKMGRVIVEGDGDRVVWSTYDFSVGAFDASAWVTATGGGTGPQLVTIMGYLSHDMKEHRVLIRAGVGGYAAGPGQGTLRLIDADIDAPTMSGLITLDVQKLQRDEADAAYGDFRATGTGTLCATDDASNCFDVTLDIDTRIQFGG